MTTTEQRLDNVERLLGTVAVSLQTTALNLQTLASTTAANQLAFEQRMLASEQRMTRVETAIDRLEAQVAQTNQNLEASIADLAGHIIQLVEQGEQQQVRVDQMVEQANADRAEMGRILDYLFGQQQNGNGRGGQSNE